MSAAAPVRGHPMDDAALLAWERQSMTQIFDHHETIVRGYQDALEYVISQVPARKRSRVREMCSVVMAESFARK